MKGISFQHITDSMRIGSKYDDIKTAIEDMYEKTKEKLYTLKYVYDIDYTIGVPYFLDRDSQADSEYKKYGNSRNQYRYDVRIWKHKYNRKITRNEIYEAMNKIYCTSYTDI